MGGFIGDVALPNWTQVNSLFSPDNLAIQHNQALASAYAPQAASLANQTNQQNLDDRGALRVLAPGLASADPSIRANALASAAVLPTVGGVSSVNALSEDAARTATSKLQLLQYGNGLPQLPYGGSISGLPASSAASQGQSPGGGFVSQMSGSESGGNAQAVNKQGYSGNFQFGTGRLADLGMYQPAQGENPNGNQWAGTITVPGFAPMSHQQFLNNPDAQRMAAEVHFKDASNQIDNTPGAENFNKNGLMAVAHLGGVEGMKQFVATNGKYNPHDSNGTSLQNYYNKFSGGGVPALQESFGHPDGPLPTDHPVRQQLASANGTAGMPQTANDVSGVSAPPMSFDDVQQKVAAMRTAGAGQASASAPAQSSAPSDSSNDVAVDPEYTANKNATSPGDPLTAHDAVAQATQELGASLGRMAPQAANQAVSDRAMQLLNADQAARSAPSQQTAANPQAAPNQLAAATPATAPSAQQAAPVQDQPAAAAAPRQFDPMAGLPAGTKPILVGPAHVPYTQGAPPGFGIAQSPDGQPHIYPLVPPALKEVKTSDSILLLDPRTGQQVSSIPITPSGRTSYRETTGGSQAFINAKPVGPIIPFSGRKEQGEAYNHDSSTVGGLAANTQASQNVMLRLNEMADLTGSVNTGSLSDFTSKAQGVLESLGVDPAAASQFTGIKSAADFQLFKKLALSTAGAAAKSDLGSNAGIQGAQFYADANPNTGLLPDANKRVTNMMRVVEQSKQDYNQAAAAHFGDQEAAFIHGGAYDQPLTSFNRQWQAQPNAQVNAAAIGILNGDPYETWAKRLSNPGDAKRAAGMAARIDPNINVPIAGGKMVPARQIVGGQ